MSNCVQRLSRMPFPGVQSRIVLLVVAVVILGLVLQGVVLRVALEEFAHPIDGLLLSAEDRAFDVTWRNVFLTAAFVIPLGVVLSVFLSFRLVGPLYRIRSHLHQMANKRDPGPCFLRTGDYFQDIPDDVNVITETLRQSGWFEEDASSEAEEAGAEIDSEKSEPVIG